MLEGKQLWLEEAWLDAEANGIFCNDSGRTFGHSQWQEMWMVLDFIVSNCTSEHSPLPPVFCTAKTLISATVWLISGKALGAPGSFLSGTLHPFLDRSWQEAVSTLSCTSPWLDFSISENFLSCGFSLLIWALALWTLKVMFLDCTKQPSCK